MLIDFDQDGFPSGNQKINETKNLLGTKEKPLVKNVKIDTESWDFHQGCTKAISIRFLTREEGQSRPLGTGGFVVWTVTPGRSNALKSSQKSKK